MVNKMALIAIFVVIMTSCGQVSEQGAQTSGDITISEVVAEPLGFDGKQVSLEGVISHICRHSGDKMRVNQQDDSDFSIMVMLQDFQPMFSSEFEGKHVKFTGVVKTVVANMDDLDNHDHDHDHDHAHDSEDGHACSSTEEAIKTMEERGISPDVRAYVEMTDFEILEEVAKEETKEEEAVEVAESSKTADGC